MGKRSHVAQAGAEDDAARRAAKKQRKLERQQQQQRIEQQQLQQQLATVDPALLLQHGQHTKEQGAAPVQTEVQMNPVQTDETARARRKAERKAAKKASKESSAVPLPTAPVDDAGVATQAEGDDERARKKAERKAAKRAKKAAASDTLDVELAPTTAAVLPAPAVPTTSASAPSTTASAKKDKKKHKHKSSSTLPSTSPALRAVGPSAQDTYLSQAHHPVDPTLAGLLSDFGVSNVALGGGNNAGASTAASRAGDIPVFGAYAPFATGPYPASSARAGDIPVTSSSTTSFPTSHSPYVRSGDIPVDPALLGPSPTAHQTPAKASTSGEKAHKKDKRKKDKHREAAVNAAGAADQEKEKRQEKEDFDVAALTARALLMAKEQHEKEMRERKEGAASTSLKGEGLRKSGKEKGKGKKDKGKEKEVIEQQENDLPDPDDLDAILASARRAAPAIASSSSSRKKPSTTSASTSSTAGTASTSKRTPAVANRVTTAGSNDFYEQLVTKWLPVKELKKLAEETGCTYKQGKFSASEDAIIRSTLDTFRDNHNMTQDELVTLMTTKKTDKSPSSAAKDVSGISANEAWELVARALGDRSLLAIYNHVNRLLAPSISGASTGRWTKEEDEALRRAVKELGNQWEEIGRQVGTRTGGSCRDRWTKQLAPGGGVLLGGEGDGDEGSGDKGEGGQKRGKWVKEEEEELRKLVEKHGKSWSLISKKMGGKRSATQCRTKWNDFLNRRDTAPSPVQSSGPSTSAPAPIAVDPALGGHSEDDMGDDAQSQKKKERDAWRWRPEHASYLVHAIKSLSPTDPTEIDWKKVPDPSGNLTHHGPKNLRDRFRHLVQGAKARIVKEKQESGRMDAGSVGVEEVSFQDAMTQLLTDYPTPGFAPKRAYTRKSTSGSKRSAKLAASSANNAAHILVGDGTGQSTLSREVVDSDEDETDEEDFSMMGMGQREPDLRVNDDETDEEENDDYGMMRMEDVVVDPLADFHKGLVDQLARAG
ncbi:hypothetical protein JCM11251_007796 [Rhodosporidiobolus azoricus]